MNTIERRFERVRRVCGYKTAGAHLSNAAFLLGYEKEIAAAPSFHAKVNIITEAFRVEAGHKVMNFLRHQKTLPPLDYGSILRGAAKELSLAAIAAEEEEALERRVVSALLTLKDGWDPLSSRQRERLTQELNRKFRDTKANQLTGKLTRALSTGLTLRSLKTGVRGMPVWARPGTLRGLVATGIYGAYKLGEPDYARAVFPTLLLFALMRADLEAAEISRAPQDKYLPEAK